MSSATALLGTTVSTRLDVDFCDDGDEFRVGGVWGGGEGVQGETRRSSARGLWRGVGSVEAAKLPCGDMRTALERAKVEYDSLSESVVRQFEAEHAEYKGT